MERTVPISTIDLFSVLDAKLLELLRSLNEEDWAKPTLDTQWTIKDIAAHLLDGNIRGISVIRDRYFGEKPESINSYRELVSFLNTLNADWVKAMQRMSPAFLISLLESSGKEYNNALAELHPFEPAVFAVAWAGEEESMNWFHIAREYTEKWHHQQQIRTALGVEEELFAPELLQPFLETSLRALPYHYRNIIRPKGFILEIRIHHKNEIYHWYLVRVLDSWVIDKTSNSKADRIVKIPASIVWKVFTNGINQQEVNNMGVLEGEKEFGMHFLKLHTVMVSNKKGVALFEATPIFGPKTKAS